jgi:hypothetical protein
MVLRLISTARPSSGFPLYSNSHPPVQARNNTIDLSAIDRKQMARRIPAANQDEFDIETLNIYGLEPSKPQLKPRHFFPVHECTPPLPTDMPYIAPKTSSYRTTGACLRYGNYDHWLSDCPKPKPRQNPRNTRSAGIGKKVTITVIDNSSSYDSDDSLGYSID